jgi:hypothetical protein
MAKLEQLGAKRHAGESTGASRSRYPRSRMISAPAINAGRSISTLDPEIESSRELGGRLGMCECLRTGLRDHYDIHRGADVRLTMTERFTQEPLHPVAHHRVADPLADGDPEATPLAGSR